MFKRVAQPAVNPALRAPERHDFWPGFVVLMIGGILAFCGARHLTGIETVNGGTAWETQLVKAFSSAGLQYAEQVAPPPPPRGNDPEALNRWARQTARPELPTWKVRVDTAAAASCPT